MDSFPLVLLLIAAIAWLAWSSIFAFWGPWRDFAAKYPAGSFRAEQMDVCPLGGFFPGWRYSFGIRVGFSEAGVHVSAIRVIVLFHPPIFVPWREVTLKGTHQWPFGHRRELVLGGELEGLRVLLSRASEEEMRLRYEEKLPNQQTEPTSASAARRHSRLI